MLLLIYFCHSLDTCSQSKLCVGCHYINDKEIVYFSTIYSRWCWPRNVYTPLQAIKDIIMLIYALLSVKVQCNLLCAAQTTKTDTQKIPPPLCGTHSGLPLLLNSIALTNTVDLPSWQCREPRHECKISKERWSKRVERGGGGPLYLESMSPYSSKYFGSIHIVCIWSVNVKFQWLCRLC